MSVKSTLEPVFRDDDHELFLCAPFCRVTPGAAPRGSASASESCTAAPSGQRVSTRNHSHGDWVREWDRQPGCKVASKATSGWVARPPDAAGAAEAQLRRRDLRHVGGLRRQVVHQPFVARRPHVLVDVLRAAVIRLIGVKTHWYSRKEIWHLFSFEKLQIFRVCLPFTSKSAGRAEPERLGPQLSVRRTQPNTPDLLSEQCALLAVVGSWGTACRNVHAGCPTKPPAAGFGSWRPAHGAAKDSVMSMWRKDTSTAHRGQEPVRGVAVLPHTGVVTRQLPAGACPDLRDGRAASAV